MIWVASLLGLGSVVGLGNWRNGVLYLLLVGFLQDPIRKVVPGFPVYIQVMVLFFLGLIVLCALIQNAEPKLAYLYGREKRLQRAWQVFIALVLVQCVHTYLLYGNPILAGLGAVNYFTPLMAIIFGVMFVQDEAWIRRFLRTYLCLAIPIALTVYLSFYYQDQVNVLRSIGRLTGSPLLIYDQGTVLYSNSGLLRAGEIAAWHAGTAVMLLVIFATTNRRFEYRVCVGVLAMLLIGVIVLTGRRKMIMAVAVFIAVFISMLMVYWRGGNKLGALLVILSASGAAYAWLQPDEGASSTLYAARSVTVFDDVIERVAQAWALAESAYQRGGFIGLGAGVAAQGSQYFGGGTRIAGGAGEAGGGKLIVELGLIGLVIVAYLCWQLIRHFHEFFRSVSNKEEDLHVLLSGITAIVIANALTFLVATQVFGDTFILVLMGFFVSFLFALERGDHAY